MAGITINEALRRASFCLREAGIEQARFEAELLLADIMACDRLMLILKAEEALNPEHGQAYDRAVYKRSKGEPLAYIVGVKHFYGEAFIVNSSVLIPRPETEQIIDLSLEWLGKKELDQKPINILDLGTGSGILAITLALKLTKANIYAVDISAEALTLAKENALKHSVDHRINWFRGDYYEPLKHLEPRPLFSLIVSNPPYLSKQDMATLPDSIRSYEPELALYGGDEGLAAYDQIFDGAGSFVSSPGLLLLEAGSAQQQPLNKILKKYPVFRQSVWHSDLAGLPRVLAVTVN